MYKQIRVLLLVVLFVLPSSPLVAQTASEILKNVADAYRTAYADIDDMAIVVRPESGLAPYDRLITYYKKVEVDGKEVFKTHFQFEGGMSDQIQQAELNSSAPMDILSMSTLMYEKLADYAEYAGLQEMDGQNVHVITVNDMNPLMQEMVALQQQDLPPGTQFEDAVFFVDPDDWVLRKMEMETLVNDPSGGFSANMGMRFFMNDYRKIGNLLYPFETIISMDNPMTPEQRAEMESQRAQIESMLDQLPESQRNQMEEMLGALGGDTIEFKMYTEDVKVNAGVPAGLFE